VGLLDAFSVKQAVIAGHDVGATVAWQAALPRPDRFKGVIALGPPFRSRAFGGSVPPTTVMPRNEKALYYQLFLQTPEAEAALGRDIRRTFRSQFYSLSGDIDVYVAEFTRSGFRGHLELVAERRSRVGAHGRL
jgi:pimeloyl-ACP methyl ester carboxylesterase